MRQFGRGERTQERLAVFGLRWWELPPEQRPRYEFDPDKLLPSLPAEPTTAAAA